MKKLNRKMNVKTQNSGSKQNGLVLGELSTRKELTFNEMSKLVGGKGNGTNWQGQVHKDEISAQTAETQHQWAQAVTDRIAATQLIEAHYDNGKHTADQQALEHEMAKDFNKAGGDERWLATVNGQQPSTCFEAAGQDYLQAAKFNEAAGSQYFDNAKHNNVVNNLTNAAGSFHAAGDLSNAAHAFESLGSLLQTNAVGANEENYLNQSIQAFTMASSFEMQSGHHNKAANDLESAAKEYQQLGTLTNNVVIDGTNAANDFVQAAQEFRAKQQDDIGQAYLQAGEAYNAVSKASGQPGSQMVESTQAVNALNNAITSLTNAKDYQGLASADLAKATAESTMYGLTGQSNYQDAEYKAYAHAGDAFSQSGAQAVTGNPSQAATDYASAASAYTSAANIHNNEQDGGGAGKDFGRAAQAYQSEAGAFSQEQHYGKAAEAYLAASTSWKDAGNNANGTAAEKSAIKEYEQGILYETGKGDWAKAADYENKLAAIHLQRAQGQIGLTEEKRLEKAADAYNAAGQDFDKANDSADAVTAYGNAAQQFINAGNAVAGHQGNNSGNDWQDAMNAYQSEITDLQNGKNFAAAANVAMTEGDFLMKWNNGGSNGNILNQAITAFKEAVQDYTTAGNAADAEIALKDEQQAENDLNG